MAFDHSKFIARFVEEAGVHCARISEGLLNLDQAVGNPELINGLFRSAHTIKGSARMMKINGVSELAHKMEDVLDAARSGRLSLTSQVADILFKGVDALVAMLATVKAGDTTTSAPEAICGALTQVVQAAEAAEAAGVQELSAASPPPVPPVPVAPPAPATPSIPPVPPVPKPAAPALPVPVVSAAAVPAAVAPTLPPTLPPTPQPPAKSHATDYLRVNSEKLDDLIRLMGEVVSEHGRYRRQLLRLCDLERQASRYLAAVQMHLQKDESAAHQVLIDTGAGLQSSMHQTVRSMMDALLMRDQMVADLQETSMRMRMQPLSTVFDPLRRTVRDLAHECGKEIDFVVEGGDTELDRKIIDRIGESLLHLIRNALDHGLENTADRLAAHKSPRGCITLSAYYDRGCVAISLSDNGRGISEEKIRSKALSKKLFEPDILAGMSRAEIINLIFVPGFSTSPIITDLSGRGVGMDVVRQSIADDLKGTIDIETIEGQGTTFLLRLPLHLAVFPLFLFAVRDKICAIPKVSLTEVLSIDRREIIEIVNKRAIRLREQIIPVEDLGRILQLDRESDTERDQLLIAIIRDGEEKLGLIVDDILGGEDMVVKPLPSHLRKLRLVSGVTLGDQDSILNVLHVPELIKQAHELAEPKRKLQTIKADRPQTVLVVDDSLNTREIEKSILEAYGYGVVLAEDGEDGWDKTRATLFDLVVTDVEMPRLDGFSLTERLRADEQYRHVPVIIVTSREKDEDKRRGIQVGANAYIVKGAFDQSNLIDTVRSLIG